MKLFMRRHEKPITVIWRFDDYSSRSSTELEVKLIDTFKKYDTSCTFGVIPYQCVGDIHDPQPQAVSPLTLKKADIFKEAIKAGVLEVALHGYSHQTIQDTKCGKYTEFFGLNYDSQLKKIAKGKNYLEKILNMPVTIFIPPWSTYDLNTMRALERLNFKIISASKKKYVDANTPSLLKFLPATCEIHRLRKAIKSARRSPEVQPVIVVIFHEYDFFEIDKERGKFKYRDFVKLLAWVSSRKYVRMRSMDQTTKVVDDLSASRFLKS